LGQPRHLRLVPPVVAQKYIMVKVSAIVPSSLRQPGLIAVRGPTIKLCLLLSVCWMAYLGFSLHNRIMSSSIRRCSALTAKQHFYMAELIGTPVKIFHPAIDHLL
ncbi:MAG: hypothetical protein LUQ51_06235, partial [Methanothrix sp.]|nr:hypothetical protein [Methanothrix sp.]